MRSYPGPVVRRVLEVAIWGRGQEADGLATAIDRTASDLLGPNPDAPAIRVDTTAAIADPSGRWHLVVASGEPRPGLSDLSDLSDLSVASGAEAEVLARDRLVPWVSRWQEGRRAPRAQTAVLVPPDRSWAPTARRLIARLRTHLDGLDVVRIDHIGSTSVDGLAAKNLIDIQVIVPTDDLAVGVAEAATGAGFVHVAGEWHGKDRTGALHPEQVCVDADPGRPVNVNIRSIERPVARDALLFRDWLRATAGAKDRYLDMKMGLAGRAVDDYGDAKEPFISAALDEAEVWGSQSGWTLGIDR